jgi:hypothetical protein
LNDGQSYPSFAKAKAVDSSVRSWMKTAMRDCIYHLTQELGEEFYLHQKIMEDVEDSDVDEDNPNDARYDRKNIDLIDFLIHLDIIHEPYHSSDSHDRAPTHTSLPIKKR